ncbi:hypothetical protein EDF57_10465 [Novosphingobium sp. PhB55]|nr:hypothetical protein EDF57_10465 [Novosphingobium sp. PhB55]
MPSYVLVAAGALGAAALGFAATSVIPTHMKMPEEAAQRSGSSDALPAYDPAYGESGSGASFVSDTGFTGQGMPRWLESQDDHGAGADGQLWQAATYGAEGQSFDEAYTAAEDPLSDDPGSTSPDKASEAAAAAARAAAEVKEAEVGDLEAPRAPVSIAPAANAPTPNSSAPNSSTLAAAAVPY